MFRHLSNIIVLIIHSSASSVDRNQLTAQSESEASQLPSSLTLLLTLSEETTTRSQDVRETSRHIQDQQGPGEVQTEGRRGGQYNQGRYFFSLFNSRLP